MSACPFWNSSCLRPNKSPLSKERILGRSSGKCQMYFAHVGPTMKQALALQVSNINEIMNIVEQFACQVSSNFMSAMPSAS